MSDTESFESVINESFEIAKAKLQVAFEGELFERLLSNLQAAHDREIRDMSQREYHRGYCDGQHSMDAEHRAVSMRLRQLPLDGGSHENLSQIARAVYHSDFGWTQCGCAALRDELVRLMGGVSDGTAKPMTTDEFIEYINEDTRRLKGDRAMEVSDDTCACAGSGACAADCGRDSGEHEEVSDDGADGDTLGPDARGHAVGRDFHELGVSDGRVAHDCADDTRGSYRGLSVHMDGLTTYDALWNERRKVIAELRRIVDEDKPITMRELADAIGMNLSIGDRVSIPTCMRLIHLLGGDQPSGIDVLRDMDTNGTYQDNNGTCPDNGPMASITDELRRLMNDPLLGYATQDMHKEVLSEIADHIDEQFDRICQQQEAVLQSTIDSMCEEQDRLQERLHTAELGCDANHRLAEANAKWADDLLDLLRDAREEYKTLDQMSAWTSAAFHAMRDRAWGLEAERDNLLDLLRDAAVDFKNASYGWDYAAIVSENITMETERNRLAKERDELRRKVDELEKFDADTSLAAFGDDNDKLRRLLSRAAKLLEIAEHDRNTNYAYWMDCKEKVVHANATIEELQAKLDEYDQTHVELPKDKDGHVFRVGCTVRMVGRYPEVLLTVHSMTLCDDGEWRLYAVDDRDEYSCNLSTSEFEVCEKPQDTAESIVRDLSMGSITESQAVERIEALNG